MCINLSVGFIKEQDLLERGGEEDLDYDKTWIFFFPITVCRHHLSKNTSSKLHPTRRDICSLTRRPSQLFQRVQSSKISNVRTLSSKKDGDKEEVSAAPNGDEKPFVVTTKKSKKDVAEPVVKASASASASASGETDPPPSESKEGKSPAGKVNAQVHLILKPVCTS